MAPLLILQCAGLILLSARPFFVPEFRSFSAPPGWILLLVFLAYAILRWPASPSPHDARIELMSAASAILAYAAWTQLTGSNHRWKVAVGILIFAATLIAWYAIIQHSQGQTMVLDRPRPAVYGTRASGTYICPNHFANLLELLLPFSLALLCTPAAGSSLRMLAGYSLPLFLLALALTQSRSGLLAMTAGLGLTGCLMAARKSRKLLLMLVVAIPLLALAAGALLWAISPDMQARLQGMQPGNMDPSASFRVMLWKDTLSMIQARPLLGFGPGSYQWVYPAHQGHALQFWVDFAHNEYLQTMAEYGIFGFLLLTAAWLTGAFRFLRVWATTVSTTEIRLVAALAGSVAAACVHALFDFNFHLHANLHVLALLAGTVAAFLIQAGSLRPLSRPAWGALALHGLVLVLALLLAMPGAARTWYADHLLQAAAKANRKLEFDRAEKLYATAIRVDRPNWRAHQGLADVCFTRAFWSLDRESRQELGAKAEQHYLAAVKRNPLDLDNQVGLAKTYSLLGRRDDALRMIDHIVAHAPRDLIFLSECGVLLRRLGEPDRAESLLSQALRIGATDTILLNVEKLRRQRSHLPQPGT